MENNAWKARFEGNDNYGRPKADYLAKLEAMTDEQLGSECQQIIYLSAWAANNHRSDYHWQCDACYAEARKRDEKASIYDKAYKRCYAEHAG